MEATHRWLSPGRLLVLCSTVYLILLLDRGVLSASSVNGVAASGSAPATGIMGAFNLTYLQDGILAAAFIVGILFFAPLFAEASKHCGTLRLLGIGLLIWVLAEFGCGASFSFWWLIVMRVLTGAGEAAITTIGPPLIDQSSPEDKKALFLAIFYLCNIVGVALGYVLGGTVADARSWRVPFFVTGCLMIPCVVLCFAVKPVRLIKSAPGAVGSSSNTAFPKAAVPSLFRDVGTVLSSSIWLCMGAAYALYEGALGTYAYFGPKAVVQLFGVAPETADVLFGGLTVLSGIVGCLAGGLVLDWMGGTLRQANLVSAASNIVGGLLCGAAYLFAETTASFFVMLVIGSTFIFVMQGPATVVAMACVPSRLRALSMSMQVMVLHALGDVPLPPIIGWVQQTVEAGKSEADRPQAWRVSLGITTLLYFPAGLLFLLGAWLSTADKDYGATDAAAAGSDAGHLLLPERSASTVNADDATVGVADAYILGAGGEDASTARGAGGVPLSTTADGGVAVGEEGWGVDAAEAGRGSSASSAAMAAPRQNEAQHASLLQNAEALPGGCDTGKITADSAADVQLHMQ